MFRESRRIKYFINFAMVIMMIVLITMGINLWGLSAYYRRNKIKSMENAFEAVDECVRDERINELQKVLIEYSEKDNISVAVYDTLNSTAIISSERDKDLLLKRLQDRLFGDGQKDNISLLKETDAYSISLNQDLIEFFGYCSDNHTMVLMSSPVRGLQQSAAESNQFFLFAALIALLIGGMVVFVMMRRTVRLEQLEKENEKLQFDLEEKEKQNLIKQEFISNVSHELKTPIALIQGYAEGLHDGLCENEESRKYYSEVILEESDRMNKIVKQLLMLNSLESGAEELDKKEFDISEMLTDICEAGRILVEQKTAKLEMDVPDKVTAYGDPFKIESVINNYFSNAVHYVSENGIIKVSLTEHDDRVRVSVFNTGEQIPESEKENIWDKFYKVDKARTRAYGGSGIGLSIVKAIMNAHNMPFGVTNLKEGVEFMFELKKKK